MATTADKLMERTMKHLVAIGDEAPVSNVEAQDFIFAANTLMAEIEAPASVDLTWTDIVNIGDTLTSPDSIIRSLAILIAIDLADSYGVNLAGTELQAKERRARDMILRVGTTRLGSYKPSTLPLGSGNEDMTYRGQRFYTGSE